MTLQDVNSAPDKLAPVILFAYNRPDHTLRTLQSLAANDLASRTDLIVYCDGPRDCADASQLERIRRTRTAVETITGFLSVSVMIRDKNLGLAASVVQGVSEVLAKSGRAIVLEDDLQLSPGFLRYMNSALAIYEHDENVMHISGYMFPVKAEAPETFFINASFCWGWATWQRAWKHYESDACTLLQRLRASRRVEEFDLNPHLGLLNQLEANCTGTLNTWAVKWYASTFLRNGLTLMPGRSLVNNLGHDGSGSNSGRSDIYHWESLAESVPVVKQDSREDTRMRAALAGFRREEHKQPVVQNPDFTGRVKSRLRSFIRRIVLSSLQPQDIEKMLNDLKVQRCLPRVHKHPTARFYPEARVIDHGAGRPRITVAADTHIRGELMLFASGGSISVGQNSFIGEGTRIWSAAGVSIGNNVLISYNCNIIDTNSHELDHLERADGFRRLVSQGYPKDQGSVDNAQITIGDYAWISFNSTILKGVKIGEGAIVAAGSVVTKDVPPFTLVGGNPARVLRNLK